jgi:hypothetical protein
LTAEYFFVALVLACFGAYLAWRNTVKVRQANASIVFIKSFAPEVAMLQNPARTKDIRDMLIEAFLRHSEAVTIFQDNLGFIRKRQFKKAWEHYHSGHGFDAERFGIQQKERLFMEYFDIRQTCDPSIFYLKKINALLIFAKQT